jgi:hypothetical protein
MKSMRVYVIEWNKLDAADSSYGRTDCNSTCVWCAPGANAIIDNYLSVWESSTNVFDLIKAIRAGGYAIL